MFRPRLPFALAALLPLALCACSAELSSGYSDDSASSPSGEGSGGATRPSTGTSGGDGDSASTPGGMSSGGGFSSSGASQPLPQAGQLTAGMWDDNKNYSFFTRYLASRGGQSQQPDGSALLWSRGEHEEAYRRWSNPRAPRAQLDVALVLDTTGSMGDELSYLQSEFRSIVARVQSKHPNTAQRWSLVVYRDDGDDYVVRTTDFKADLDGFQKLLAAQHFGGGGDFPEAADQALNAAVQDLSWRREATASRIVFWVADAPAHAANYDGVRRAVLDAARSDIRIYPVAASSADSETQYLMRGAAQLTGGRYTFLTDDSGIGNAHEEPEVPCYHVTRLDHALLRAIDHELRGVSSPPEAAQIVRSVGNPVENVCQTSRGEAYAY